MSCDQTKVERAIKALPEGEPFDHFDVEAQLERLGLEVAVKVDLKIAKVKGVRRTVRGMDRPYGEPRVNLYIYTAPKRNAARDRRGQAGHRALRAADIHEGAMA